VVIDIIFSALRSVSQTDSHVVIDMRYVSQTESHVVTDIIFSALCKLKIRLHCVPKKVSPKYV